MITVRTQAFQTQLTSPGSLEDKKRIEETQQHVEEWIVKHQKDYIAHAIWSDNVEGALISGMLEPAEAQLRKKGSVSFEAGAIYGSRKTLDISQIVDDFMKNHITLPKRAAKTDKIPLLSALQFRFTNLSTVQRVLENKLSTITLSDNQEYPLTIESTDCFINGFPWIDTNGNTLEWRLAINKLIEQYALSKKLCTSTQIQISSDHLSDMPIDKILAMTWKKCKELPNCDQKALARFLLQKRELAITPSKLNADIRCSYNSIWWCYGDVIVLRGSTDSLLSVTNDVPLKDDYEVRLREPFENGGNFLSLDLSQKDTIIIGPKKILAQYQDTMKSKGIQSFYTDDMTPEQIDFFKVPNHILDKALPARPETSLSSTATISRFTTIPLAREEDNELKIIPPVSNPCSETVQKDSQSFIDKSTDLLDFGHYSKLT